MTAEQRRTSATPRGMLLAVGLIAGVALLAAGIVRWRPSAATNAPYTTVVARWTIENIADDQAFVGLGVFVYRPNWHGPTQTFAGPVLLEVQEAQTPLRILFAGEVAVRRAGEAGEPVLTTGAATPQAATPTTNDLTLGTGDLVAVPAGTPFSVTTGEGEVVRLQATAILPSGPPATPGIQQVEWRSWGIVRPAPEVPLVVTVTDVQLAGGEAFRFQRDKGPALLSIEGTGDGTQSIALTVTKGRGTYLRVTDVPPWDVSGAVVYVAVQTPTSFIRERQFDARSGAFLPVGTAAILRNKSLVDGTPVRMVTFDGPRVVTPVASPSPLVTIVPTALKTPA